MSKTVKRVSKTVKRVMTVMIVGLVAILGAKAEAHYIVVKGKVKFCSICVAVELKHDETVPPGGHPEEVEFRAKTTKIDILCPDGTKITSSDLFNLVVRRTIGGGDITTQVGDKDVPILTTAEVEAIISDTALLVNSNVCGVPPRDVLIRAMNLKIISNQCTSTPCATVSTFEADCTLSNKFNLKKYPKNLPPTGAGYDCPNPKIENM